MTQAVVRAAGIEDAEGIATVHVAAWRETYRGMVPNAFLENLSVARRAAQWMGSLSDPSSVYHRALAAELNGQIVGFANYGFPQEEDEEFDGELYAIYLLKSAQGRGIGRALFTEAAKGLLELGSSSMLVWVLKENPARGFYEHLGGVYLREKPIEIGSVELMEVAYGWRELKTFRRG
ncbi:MAG: GNAT family N-acetyltransferase [Anaerolineales bacterium]|nr:GNAT family N-acetyltransferase [Anaerolineales bacterium]NUQ83955.1 GNAT family N-acetyltransferase [Anaerolineales bacterium]